MSLILAEVKAEKKRKDCLSSHGTRAARASSSTRSKVSRDDHHLKKYFLSIDLEVTKDK